MLKLKQLVKTYPKSAFSVRVPELQLEQGELFALLGPSGCGKTTLLRVVAGLLTLDQGEITWGSKQISCVPPEKRGFSMVFQQALLFPHLNVLDNVSFGLRMQKVSKVEISKRALDMLEEVNLSGLEHRFPSELSGGQQQRVAIARALVTKPTLLLMDEPFSALDPSLRQSMRELVIRLHQEHQVTTLFVTHDQEEAFLLANRMAVMEEGSILQVGKPQHLYEQPESIEVASFLGVKNILWGQFSEGVFHSEDFHCPLPSRGSKVQGMGWLILRPETLYLQPRSSTQELAYCLQGTIDELSYIQGFYHLKVAVGSHQLEVIQPKQAAQKPTLGEPITLQVSLAEVHWILADQ